MPSHDLDIPMPGGVCDAYVAYPDTPEPWPTVLFLGDAIGLRPVVRDMLERFAAEGYYVLAPNLTWRVGPAPMVDVPGIFAPERGPELGARIGELVASLPPETGVRDIAEYLDFLAAQPESRPGPVGLVGYCFGGVLAIRTAGHLPERVAATACFHGSDLASERPDSPHLLADRITAELYIAHAENDPSMPPEQVALLDETLTKAGVTYKAEVYAGTRHAFTMADTRAYVPEALDRHWTAVLELFGRTLRP